MLSFTESHRVKSLCEQALPHTLSTVVTVSGGEKNIIPLFNSVNDIKKKKDTFPFSFWSLLKIRASLAASGGFWKPLSLECVQAGLSTLDPVPGTTWLLRWQEVCDPSYSLACLRKEMFGAKWSRVPAFIEHLQTMRATGSQSGGLWSHR